jgi:hypothetical protein
MNSNDINDIIAAWELMGQRCGAGWSRVTFKEFIASLPEGYFPDGLPSPLPEPKEPPAMAVVHEEDPEEDEEEEDLLCMKCNTEHEGNWCPEAEEEDENDWDEMTCGCCTCRPCKLAGCEHCEC